LSFRFVAAQEDIGESCDNPNLVSENSISEDSIPSLQYSADETNNDDEQKARKAKDFELYFSAYGELYHQKSMLTDIHRMDSYFTAIMANAEAVFKDKIIMDVGTGSGILAIWAAKAGAKKVYAIEYTDMAHNARKLVQANGVQDVVTVIQGTVEGIKLPLKEDGLGDDDNQEVVDVIVSEWMGYMLIRESMLDSVLVARDRYLKKETGMMFPSHATIKFAPIVDEKKRRENSREYEDTMDDWYDFVENTKDYYGGVDYSTLTEAFEKENRNYYFETSQWVELPSNAELAKAQVLKTLDLMTCTHQDTRGIFDSSQNSNESQKGNVDSNTFDFVLDPNEIAVVSGFAAWFTTDFRSRTDDMASKDAPKLTASPTLNTGPEQGYTHWGQQVFYFRNALSIQTALSEARGSPNGDETVVHLKGSLEMFRTKENTRMYQCRIKHFLEEQDQKNQIIRATDPVENIFAIP